MPEETHCCHQGGSDETPRRIDWLLWISLGLTGAGIALSFVPGLPGYLTERGAEFCHSTRDLMSRMWWGLVLGIVAVGFLQFIPRKAIKRLLGDKADFTGLLRATVAGTLLDVCSHGVLLVAMELYRRGLSIGQTVAFLIASPWNSLSLTLILIALIGWKWTLAFLGLSLGIALLTGAAFAWMESRGFLPAHPHRNAGLDEDDEGTFRENVTHTWRQPGGGWKMIAGALSASRMVLRWIFFGIVLASAVRALVDPGIFAQWFGPTVAGLLLTLVAATLIEVCSEGSVPLASDLLTRAAAPGNGFAFLMAGVATDYTEILAVRESTRSWKVALLLPALTVPQIVLIAWLMNRFGG